MRAPRLLRRLLRGFCYLAVFLATLELCVRAEAAYRWGAPFWGEYSMDSLRSSGAHGYFNRPGARFEKWQINAAGFRGPEIAVEKPAGVTRVGVVGASEVFGLYESPGKELTAQLQAILDARMPGQYEVVNLAAAGMSPPRILELFERWAGRFGVDVVIVYTHPAFYLDLEPPRRSSPRGRRPPEGVGVSLRLPDRAWRTARQRLPQLAQDALKRMAIDRERSRHPQEWIWDSPPLDRLALFKGDTGAAIRAIQRAGARVILATHASRFGVSLDSVDRRMLLTWNRFYPRATGPCLLRMEKAANSVVRQLAASAAIPVLDLGASMSGVPGYFADFSHFTDEGAAFAAEAIARALLTDHTRSAE